MNIVATTADNSHFYMPLGNSADISAADFIVFEDPRQKAIRDSLEKANSTNRLRQALARQDAPDGQPAVEHGHQDGAERQAERRNATNPRPSRRQPAQRTRQRHDQPTRQSAEQRFHDLRRLRHHGRQLPFFAEEFRYAHVCHRRRQPHPVDGRSGQRAGRHHGRLQAEGLAGPAARGRGAELSAQRPGGLHHPAVRTADATGYHVRCDRPERRPGNPKRYPELDEYAGDDVDPIPVAAGHAEFLCRQFVHEPEPEHRRHGRDRDPASTSCRTN